MWSVDEEFDQPIRHFNFAMSGGSFCAIFTLRLTPNLDDKGVYFVSELTDDADRHWALFIEEGVMSFLAQRHQEGRAIGYLRIALVDIQVHPVDSKAHRFKEAALMAMEMAFESHGIWLG